MSDYRNTKVPDKGIEKPKENYDEVISAKLPGRTFLKITGILHIVIGILGIGTILALIILIALPVTRDEVTSYVLAGLLLLLPIPSFALIIGIFAIKKFGGLKRARTLRTLSIVNIIIIGVIFTILWPAPTLVLIVTPVLPILFLVAAYKNYNDCKKLHEIQDTTSLRHISGKPSFIADDIIIGISIITGILFLLRGQSVGFFLFLIFIVVPVGRWITSRSNSIVVDDIGIFGKIKREPFQLTYHEISSVGMSMINETDRTNLHIVSGCRAYSIRIRNAYAVRDAILYNMSLLGLRVALTSVETPASVTMPEHGTSISQADASHTGDSPAAETGDPLRQQIVTLYRHEIVGLAGRIPTFHLFEEIPSHKLKNAMKSYVPSLESDERVIFLFDGTMTGSGKSGFILTTKNLYNKPTLTKATKSCVGKIVRVADMSEHKNDKYVITVEFDTGNHIQIIMGADTIRKKVIARVLDETIRILKKQQEVK